MIHRVITSLVIAGVCAALAPAQPAQSEEQAARIRYARTTYFKRYSTIDEARTAKLGLPAAAAAVVDLYLDLARNRDALRSRENPETGGSVTLPYLLVTCRKTALVLRVFYRNLDLAEAELPTRELPPLLAGLAGERVLEFARTTTEDHERMRKLRLVMLAELLRVSEPARMKDPELERDCRAMAPTFSALALEELDASAGEEWIAPLTILRHMGDAPAARALVKRMERDRKSLPPDVRARLLGTICNMRIPAAEKFLLSILDGDNVNRKARTIRTLERMPGPEAEKRLAAIITEGSKEPRKVQGATLRALERIPSERALRIIRDTFRATKDETRREKISMALARRGDSEGLGYVMTRFDGMKDDAAKLRFAIDMARVGQRWVAPYLRKKVARAEAGQNNEAKALVPLVKSLLERLDGPGGAR